MMGLDEEKLARTRSGGRTRQSTSRWRSLGKEGFARRNGDVSRGHVDEAKIRRGEELGGQQLQRAATTTESESAVRDFRRPWRKRFFK